MLEDSKKEFNIDLLKRLMDEINKPRYIVFGSRELSDDILQQLKDLQCEYKRISNNYIEDDKRFLLIGTDYFEHEPFNVDHIKSKELIYKAANGYDTPFAETIKFKVNNSK